MVREEKDEGRRAKNEMGSRLFIVYCQLLRINQELLLRQSERSEESLRSGSS